MLLMPVLIHAGTMLSNSRCGGTSRWGRHGGYACSSNTVTVASWIINSRIDDVPPNHVRCWVHGAMSTGGSDAKLGTY